MSDSSPPPGDQLDAARANEPNPADDPAAAAIADYFVQVDRGERVDREAFIADHPAVADLLREFFAGANLVEQFAGPTFAEQTIRLSVADTARSQIVAETVPGLTSSQIAAAEKAGLPREPFQDVAVPDQLGRYRLERIIGRGAMGTVYLAHDEQLHRDVALKVPRFEVDGSRDELMQRFFREARSVALLRDAGVCPVYDVDEVDGIHFIAMAYIDGQPLSYLLRDGQHFEPRESAVLVLKVARALGKAHAHGIVHRDVKPGNIMIDHDGEPVIMDFGLAARLDMEDVRVTQHGTLLGTPAYMSPEQVAGDPEAISRSSDIFSLGVILYELLAGRLPFEGTILSIAHQIAHDEPQPLSDLDPQIDTSLEAVCTRMLAKRPTDRFASMNEVAAALRDYVMGPNEPNAAGDEWATAKNSAARTAVETPAVWDAIPSSDALPGQSRARIRLLAISLAALAGVVFIASNHGHVDTKAPVPEVTIPTGGHPVQQTATGKRSVGHPTSTTATVESDPQPIAGHALEQPSGSPMSDLAVSEDGRYLVTGSDGGEVSLWDSQTGLLIRRHYSGAGADDELRPAVIAVAMSPDGHLLGVTAGDSVIVWSTVDGRFLYRQQPGGVVLDVAFSPDGKFLLTSTDQGDMQLWLTETGKLERRFQPVPYAIRAVEFSPDSRYIFSGEYRPLPDATGPTVIRGRRLLKQWNVETGELLRIFHGETGNVRTLDVAPDGRSLLTGGEDAVIRRWDLDNGQVVREFHVKGAVSDVRHSHNGRYFAASSLNETGPRIWQMATSQEIADRRVTTTGQSVCIEFSPDGRLLFMGGSVAGTDDEGQQGFPQLRELEDHLHSEPVAEPTLSQPTPRIETAIAQPLQRFRGHTDEVLDIEFVNDGRAAFSVGRDGTIRHWGIADGRLLTSFDPQGGPIRDLAVSPDERFIATAHQDGAVNLLSASSAEVLLRLEGHTDPVDSLHFSADGLRLASAGRDGFVRIWNVADGALQRELRADPVANWTVRFLAGDRLFGAGERHSRLWNLSTGHVLKTFGTNNQLYYGAEPTPDGQSVVFGNYDGQIGVWNFDGQASGVLIGQHSRFVSLSKELAGDGRFVVTGGDEAVLVTDLEEGNTVYRLNLGPAGAGVLSLSPDERFLLVTARDPHLEDGPGFALQLFELPLFVRTSGRD